MRRALTVVAVLGGLLAPALPGIAAPARTGRSLSVGDARRAAAALRARVDALRTQAEIATEDYDAAYAALGAAVTAHLTAGRNLQQAQATAGASEAARQQRIRALYMSGGASGLYASVLASTDLTEAFSRIHQVSAVLTGDSRQLSAAGTAVAARRMAEDQLATAADASTALQRRVAARGDAVRTLLARTDALLAQADATVVRLAEEQRRAAEAAAAARAATQLAAAQAAILASSGNLAGLGVGSGGLPTAQLGSVSGRGSVGPGSVGPGSVVGLAALAFARSQTGKPYVWGATGFATYDCSGLTGAAWAAAGVRLPRTSRQQWFAGPHVGLGELQPGDLLFWASNPADPATIHHVALYAGGGLMVAAPHTGDVVKVQPVYLDGYVGAVRPAA